MAEDLVEGDAAVRQLGTGHAEMARDTQRAQVDLDPFLGARVPHISRSVLHPGDERREGRGGLAEMYLQGRTPGHEHHGAARGHLTA